MQKLVEFPRTMRSIFSVFRFYLDLILFFSNKWWNLFSSFIWIIIAVISNYDLNAKYDKSPLFKQFFQIKLFELFELFELFQRR